MDPSGPTRWCHWQQSNSSQPELASQPQDPPPSISIRLTYGGVIQPIFFPARSVAFFRRRRLDPLPLCGSRQKAVQPPLPGTIRSPRGRGLTTLLLRPLTPRWPSSPTLLVRNRQTISYGRLHSCCILGASRVFFVTVRAVFGVFCLHMLICLPISFKNVGQGQGRI